MVWLEKYVRKILKFLSQKNSKMLLIVWLWNPWKQYEKTRHNAGFLVVEKLAEYYNANEWKNHRESKSLYTSGIIENHNVLFIKPQTYMNRSWQSVWYRQRFYKIAVNDILVIHDDIDLPPQRLKLKKWGSSGWQNGINDIITKLGTKDFWRLKCGIGRPVNPKFEIKDYVLGTMQWEELAFWEDETQKFVEKVEEWKRNKNARR